MCINRLEWQDKKTIEKYIESLHSIYKPKSVKRKIASIKAFFHYLELEEILEINPFHRIQIKYKKPFILPKTIPLKNIERIIIFAYKYYEKAQTDYSKKTRLRNALILELLFATGMRISELCSLKMAQIDLSEYIIKIYGKGSKERLIQICNKNVQVLLNKYIKERKQDSSNNDYLFINCI